MKRIILYMLSIILLQINLPAQDIKIIVGFDTSRIFIGDQIKYSLTISQPSGLTVAVPIFKDTIAKNIEVISGPSIDTAANNNGNLLIRHNYLITSFDTGKYQIRPVYAELKSAEGIKRFYTDYIYLEVIRPDITPPDSTARIFDIVAPYRAPITLGEILPWILVVIITFIVAYLVYRYIIKFRKKPGEPEIIAVLEPAHVIALRELEMLKEEKLWQKGEIKQYYSRLTEILRKYLENRFRVYSLELTTAETLDELLKAGFTKNSAFNDLKSVLTGADMVKFAKYAPEPTENESYYQTAINFVLQTKQNESSATTEPEDREKGGAS